MNKERFVSELRELKPSAESFASLGYSPDLIRKRLSGYECKKRPKQIFNIQVSCELVDLINSYDCTNVEVGVLSFGSKISETPDFVMVGNVEADILAIRKITMEIVVLDHVNFDWIIWACASNGKNFLDALIICVEFFSKRINNPQLATNHGYTYETVLICAEKAGGDKYLDFFKLLLGYDF